MKDAYKNILKSKTFVVAALASGMGIDVCNC
jgi:hypothetical protein